MKSPSLSPVQTPRLWSGHLPSPLPRSDLPFKEQRPSGGETGGGLRVPGKEWGDASIFYQMALSVCFQSLLHTSMIFLYYISSPLLIYFSLSSLCTPLLSTSSMLMVEEGVVIIALVIPHSYIVREYTPDPQRTVSGAVKHAHNQLSPVAALLFTLSLCSCLQKNEKNVNISIFNHPAAEIQGVETYESSVCIFFNLEVYFQQKRQLIWQLAASRWYFLVYM